MHCNYMRATEVIVSKLLYKSLAVSNFHGREFEIWAGFWPVGSNEKNWSDYEQRLRVFFHEKSNNFF